MKKFVVSLLCSAAIAAATPVSVSYVNAGTPGILDSDHAYVGPYTLKIGGKNVAAMCVDDFYQTSGSWSANLTGANASDLGKTYLGSQTFTVNGNSFTSGQIYGSEAYLFSELVKPGADRVDIQDAAWTLMDNVTGHTLHSTTSTVNGLIGDALANSLAFNAAGYQIVSDVNSTSRREQEFIVATPEPASMGLLGGTLFLLGMTRVWSKRGKKAAAVQA